MPKPKNRSLRLKSEKMINDVIKFDQNFILKNCGTISTYKYMKLIE